MLVFCRENCLLLTSCHLPQFLYHTFWLSGYFHHLGMVCGFCSTALVFTLPSFHGLTHSFLLHSTPEQPLILLHVHALYQPFFLLHACPCRQAGTGKRQNIKMRQKKTKRKKRRKEGLGTFQEDLGMVSQISLSLLFSYNPLTVSIKLSVWYIHLMYAASLLLPPFPFGTRTIPPIVTIHVTPIHSTICHYSLADLTVDGLRQASMPLVAWHACPACRQPRLLSDFL